MQGFSGVQAPPYQSYTMLSSSSPSPQPSKLLQVLGYILRIITMMLILISTIIMGAAKQSKSATATYQDYVYDYNASVRSSDSSSFRYFIAAEAIVIIYSLVALVLSVTMRDDIAKVHKPLSILDLVVVVLLFSCNGAAIAIAVVAEHGNDNFRWNRICDVVGNFCSQFLTAIVMSMLASVVYMLMTALNLLRV